MHPPFFQRFRNLYLSQFPRFLGISLYEIDNRRIFPGVDHKIMRCIILGPDNVIAAGPVVTPFKIESDRFFRCHVPIYGIEKMLILLNIV